MSIDRRQAGVVALGIIGITAVAAAAVRLVPHAPAGWGATVAAANDLVQMAAILVGGWWTYRLFVRQRHDSARANISHAIQHLELQPGLRLLHVVAQIENVGNVALRPPRSSTTVQQVLPLAGEYRQRAEQNALIPINEYEVDWPKIGEHEIDLADDDFILEPGESDRYHMDFVISVAVTAVQVHTMVYCGGHDATQFWDATSVLDLLHPAPDAVGGDLPAMRGSASSVGGGRHGPPSE